MLDIPRNNRCTLVRKQSKIWVVEKLRFNSKISSFFIWEYLEFSCFISMEISCIFGPLSGNSCRHNSFRPPWIHNSQSLCCGVYIYSRSNCRHTSIVRKVDNEENPDTITYGYFCKMSKYNKHSSVPDF